MSSFKILICHIKIANCLIIINIKVTFQHIRGDQIMLQKYYTKYPSIDSNSLRNSAGMYIVTAYLSVHRY